MSTEGLWLSLICAFCVGAISLISSHLSKKEFISSELMCFVSFFPAFVYSCFALIQQSSTAGLAAIAALFFKNILYGLSFYLRFEALRVFTPFVGTMMLGIQPILVFAFGSLILGEKLTMLQAIGVALASIGLFLMTGFSPNDEKRISVKDFIKYFVFPMLASAAVILWDRFYLRGVFSSHEYFVLDRLLVFPAFLAGLFALKRDRSFLGIFHQKTLTTLKLNWSAIIIFAALFCISIYTYNSALALEKAALVSLIRNASYPIAAFIGIFLFPQKMGYRKWLSLALIVLAVVLSSR